VWGDTCAFAKLMGPGIERTMGVPLFNFVVCASNILICHRHRHICLDVQVFLTLSGDAQDKRLWNKLLE
jgi:hypothetical protein